jgi:GH43 family beta-xylosidase
VYTVVYERLEVLVAADVSVLAVESVEKGIIDTLWEMISSDRHVNNHESDTS